MLPEDRRALNDRGLYVAGRLVDVSYSARLIRWEWLEGASRRMD
jgi:hypothetical protein